MIIEMEQIEMEQMILDSVDRFLDAEVRPHVHRLEKADEYPAAIVEKNGKLIGIVSRYDVLREMIGAR